MTKDEALALLDTKWWELATDADIVGFQLYEPRLCMPWSRFHAAVEACLKRPVYTHEFASSFVGQLQAEFNGTAAPRTLQQIIELIPADKRVVVVVRDDA